MSPARKSSAEVELGDAWTSGGDPDATYAVRWIEATGEVYALPLVEPLDGRFRIWLYWFTGALVPNWRKNDRPEVTVLGVCASTSDLDTRLRGWQDKMHEPGSLEWLKERLET